MIDFDLPARTEKPRAHGLSNLVDNGYGLGELRDKLALAADFIDIVKLGWASANITNCLKDKVSLFKTNDITTCPGGMLFELSWWQGKMAAYIDFLVTHEITMAEVSNGSLPIPEKKKREMISLLVNEGFTVLSEVGSKDVSVNAPPAVWVDCLKRDLDCGAWKVIAEGRADASAGIYDTSGEFRFEVINAILGSGIPLDAIIFEAPHKQQMKWFVENVGPNVNIGNVPLGEVLNLETLRLGLRGDTVWHFHEGNEVSMPVR